MKEQITYDDFDKIDIRVGTVISVKKNEKARKPSLVIEVDFGKEIGIKQSSAQITHYYNEKNLKGKQVVGICNFPEKNIAGIVSQVLIFACNSVSYCTSLTRLPTTDNINFYIKR